jgi:hypothetical protein
MISLHKIHLSDVVLFKKEIIQIDKNCGLVIVQGLNLDSDESDNTNGAGKSLAFSTLPNVLFESTPISQKKRSKKEILLGKTSKVGIEYTADNQNKYKVEQHPGSYKVSVNGKDQCTSKQEVAKKFLSNTFPLSEHEFYSTCYVQNLKPLYFQVESDSNRLKFITDVFDLDEFDRIRKKLGIKKGEIKDKEIEYSTIAGQLDLCLQHLAKIQWTTKKNLKLKSCNASLTISKTTMQRLYKKQQTLESLQEEVSELAKLKARATELTSKLPNNANLEVWLNTQMELHKKLEDYKGKSKIYNTLSSSIRSRLAELRLEIKGRKILPVGPLRLKFSKMDLELEGIESLLHKALIHNSLLTEITGSLRLEKAKLKKFGFIKISDIPKYSKMDLALAQNTLRISANLEKCGRSSTDCPTCGSPFDVKVLKKLSVDAKRKIKAFSHLEKASECAREIIKITKRKKSKGFPKEVKTLKLKEDRLKRSLKRLETFGLLMREWEQQNIGLGNLSKPTKPKKYPDLSYSRDFIEKSLYLNHELKLVNLEMSKIKHRFGKVNPVNLSRSLDLCNSHLEEEGTKLDLLHERSREFSLEKREHEVLTKQKKNLQKDLSYIAPLIHKKKLVDYLYKKYGATEFKLDAARAILKLLQKSLNQYSSLVFPEKVQFKLDPSSRGVGSFYKTSQNGIWADIRHMSGAERNCFRLLFVLALLPLIPASRRTNFIILDEPDSACSESVRSRIIENFLPKLRQVVPHIFWITPKESESFKDADVWTVIKNNGVSTIRKNNQ